ncbi:MAG: hypothetical protein NVS2B16_35220 [Chloroflexota bacterium]
MANGALAPVRNDASQGRTQAKGSIGCLEPQEATVAGQRAKVKRRIDGLAEGRLEGE